MRRHGLWQEEDAACAERNRPTYNEVEEEADSTDGGDGGDGEDLVDGAQGYPPTLHPGPVEPDCPPRGQVRFVEYPYEDWSPHWVGWEHDDVSLAEDQEGRWEDTVLSRDHGMIFILYIFIIVL